MRATRFLCLCLALLAAPLAGAEQALRYSVSLSWNMPYARFDGEQLVGGVLYDLALAVGKQLQMPVTFIALPRKRLDASAQAGEMDLRCYLTPQWTEFPDQYQWSGRLFEVSDVVFGVEGSSPPRDLADLPAGSALSAVLGYGYPELEPLFASRQLLRDDSPNQEKVNLKLSAGRTPYGVSEALALSWYQRTTPRHRHAAWRLVIARQDFQCGIPKKGAVPAGKILKALEALKKANQFEDILRKYR